MWNITESCIFICQLLGSPPPTPRPMYENFSIMRYQDQIYSLDFLWIFFWIVNLVLQNNRYSFLLIWVFFDISRGFNKFKFLQLLDKKYQGHKEINCRKYTFCMEISYILYKKTPCKHTNQQKMKYKYQRF